MICSLACDVKQRQKYSLYKIIDLFLYEESKEIFQIQNDSVHLGWYIFSMDLREEK